MSANSRQPESSRRVPGGILFVGALAVVLIVAIVADRRQRASRPTGVPPPIDTHGKWFPAPTLAGLSAEAREQLGAVGYLAAYESAPATSGVTQHDEAHVWAGLNLITSGDGPAAVLTDMDGRILHRWSKEYNDVFQSPAIPKNRSLTFGESVDAQPDFDKALMARLPAHFRAQANHGHSYYRRAWAYPNGDLLTFFSYLGFVKLDRGSNVLWSRPMMAHHDVTVDTAGNIFTIALRPREVSGMGENGFILDDCLVVMNDHGNVMTEISVLDAFLDSPFAAMVGRATQHLDLIHTNSIEVLDGAMKDRMPGFREGNLLISCRNLHTVAVIDPAREVVVWAAAGPWAMQHDAQVIDDRRMLLFDNLGNGGYSRILEFDPATFEILWQYAGAPPDSFFSRELGAVTRLPNGNTLVTESTRGRAFEIAPEREIVWEFVNPMRAGEHNELIAAVFDVVRLPGDFGRDWLKPAAPAAE